MGSNQSVSSKAILNNANNLYQNSSAVCIGSCNAIAANQTITLNNTNLRGNIDITNTCQASASCVMQSQLDSQVENIMGSISKQQNITTQLLPIAFDFNNKNSSSVIKQNITNNITQTLQSVCQATDNTITTNLTIVGSNSTIGGNISIVNGGDANANCTINNLARMTLYNQSVSSDSSTVKQANVFAVMMIAVVIIMVIGVIIMVIIIGPAGLVAVVGSIGGKGDKGEEGEEGAEGSEGSEIGELENMAGEAAEV